MDRLEEKAASKRMLAVDLDANMPTGRLLVALVGAIALVRTGDQAGVATRRDQQSQKRDVKNSAAKVYH
jgi:hypothetical protein